MTVSHTRPATGRLPVQPQDTRLHDSQLYDSRAGSGAKPAPAPAPALAPAPARTSVQPRRVQFAAPALQGHEWLVYDISGAAPGPRLCVMAGMHVNEVAGIRAAQELVAFFADSSFRGQVSILPVLNRPGVASRAQHVCPIDGKNINFSFPGSATGSFSDALADAILNDWAADADVLIDLHGGDLCERVVPFTVVPTTDDAALDAVNLALARAFDPAVIVRLPHVQLDQPGRSCSGRARQGRRAVFAEAGANGLLDADSVRYHMAGVQRVATYLGMLPQTAPPGLGQTMVATAYHWLQAGAEGWCDYAVEPGDAVQRGQTLATITDFAGRLAEILVAPADGVLLWRCTHPLVVPGSDLFGLGGVAPAAPGIPSSAA